ncbi:MAG: SIMPL domain-containing protein [Pseudobdellovibrio sp.]
MKIDYSKLLVAVSFILTGLLLRDGLIKFRTSERTVEVRGLSERIVKSNQALWQMSFSVQGNELKSLNQNYRTYQQTIIDFLKKLKFQDTEIQKTSATIIDNFANSYGNQRPEFKYTLKGSITVLTNQVDLVAQSAEKTDDLLNLGVALESSQVQFFFTDLNKLKPEMIKEATQNARDSAQKFADDSTSHLGDIKYASQGLFSIDDAGNTEYSNNASIDKKIRVVTQITYFLK